MSFSAVMDEVNPEFEVPTRPVTPDVQHNDPDAAASNNIDNNGRNLYYSESVNRELNKLSKDLSGVLVNTVFSSKADRMPPAFGGDSGIYSHMNHESKRPNEDVVSQNLHGYQVSQARYTLTSTNPPLQHPSGQPNDMMTALHQPSTSTAHAPQAAQLNHLLAAFYAPQFQQRQMAVDPALLSPITASSSSASPPPGLLDHLSPPPDYTSHLPDLYVPLSAPSSQPHTSGDSAGSPPSVLTHFFSPNQSAPETMLDATISETEEDKGKDEYQPTPRRPSAPAGTSRSGSSNPKPKAVKGKSKLKSNLPSPYLEVTSTLDSTAIIPNFDAPDLEMTPAAPDAEANSEYQDSESGDECYSEKQGRPSYSGGPARPKGSEKHRPASKPAHPYKNFKNLITQGTGRQMCKYISPYDGWKCEQILARSYDVPRHMEVHAKEEYELVLTGKLPVQNSELFECVTEANVYVCLVCRKDFSRKDAMQRHVRSSSKMSKAKHRAEAKASLKKRALGTPTIPHPNAVPAEILQRHRRILEKLKVEAQELGQDVTDWDVENMIPQVGDDTELFGTGPNAPGIPVGRRGGGKPRADEAAVDPAPSRPTRASNRPAANEAEQMYDEEEAEENATTGTPGPESAQALLKTPTPASVKPAAVAAAVAIPSPQPQEQQPGKLRLIKKALRRTSEASSYGEEEERDRANFAQTTRYRSSHTRTRSPEKLETRTTKQQDQVSEPSSVASMETEEKRDTTESEDEEDTYQEETRRRLSDEEVEDLMEVD